MNTLEQILEIILENKKPYLYLRLHKSSYQISNVGSFECFNCLPDEHINSRTEKASEWLKEYVEKFPSGSVFSIIIKSNPKANGAGIIGPIEFSTKAENKESSTINNGFSGIPDPMTLQQMGFMQKGEVEAQILAERLTFQQELHKREVQEMTKEFNEKLEYTEQSYKTWDPESMDKFAKTVTKGLALLFGKDVKGLEGTESKEEKPKDLKRVTADSFADDVYNELSLPEIEKLKILVKELKGKKTKVEDVKEVENSKE